MFWLISELYNFLSGHFFFISSVVYARLFDPCCLGLSTVAFAPFDYLRHNYSRFAWLVFGVPPVIVKPLFLGRKEH